MDPLALDAALAGIAAAPSGLVRWGLDALLALQVGSGVVLALPQTAWLRLLLLALVGPLGLLWCLGWALQGASGSAALLAGWRGDEPQPSGRRAPGLRLGLPDARQNRRHTHCSPCFCTPSIVAASRLRLKAGPTDPLASQQLPPAAGPAAS